MKRIIIAVIATCLVFLSSSTTVFALSVNGPHSPGPLINGWYKDSLTASISGQCTHGSNGSYGFDYSSTDSGTHKYYFYTDSDGNPYVSIDTNGSGYTPLNNQPCGYSLDYLVGYKINLAQSFTASVDSQPPSVSITTPSGGTTTTASSYTLSGPASDPENNLASVKAIISGVTGPSASVSGNTFKITVPLNYGSTSVQMIAYDNVGHTATSNTVSITRVSPSSPTPSSSTTSTPSSATGNQASQVLFSPQQVINIDDPYANQVNSSPSDVQASASIAGIGVLPYWFLILLMIILSAICLFIMNKYRPIFSNLGKNKSSLKKRIIMVVALPSIIPLLGLGILGYQQLSSIIKNSLSDQLYTAAQTSALKLQREFGIRSIVITKTSSDIIQIQDQYKVQIDQLTQQKNNCQQIITAAIPARQYSRVTSASDCLPFLSGFAQLISNSSSNVSDYLNALNKGDDNANNNLVSQENERVSELLGSLRDYFPALSEVDIVDASKQANLQAVLPNTDPTQPAISTSRKDLLAVASSKKIITVQTSGKTQQLLLTYPILSGTRVLGGVVAAIDTGNFAFIPSIWQSTPKPYSMDQVFFVTTAGDIIAPQSSSNKQLQSQVKQLAATASGTVFNLNVKGQILATRTSTVPNTNLVVAVGAPASSVLAPLAGIQLTTIVAIVGFVLLSVILGMWFASGISSEIDWLFLGAQNYSKGNLDYHIKLKTHDELQMLGDTMNQMAAEIKTAQAALLQKDKDFINVATHELRAPITSIIGFLSMVSEDGMGTVDDKAKKLIDQAYTSTKRLREIINDMLDIARLESGHTEFTLEPVDICELTQSIIDMQSIVAQQAGLNLIYQANKDLPIIEADKNKLQIILTNFISNAIKYNRPNGSITVSHSVKGNKIITSITDTGLGIPDDQKAHMFEKFYRVQNEDRAKVPGTGLGLHVTKRFIEAMGGNVWYESTHGHGTTFYFSLPITAQKTEMIQPEEIQTKVK